MLTRAARWPTWDGKALAFLALVDLTDLGGFEADVILPDVGCVNFF